MKNIISFGNHSATLCIGEHTAILTTDEKSLPTKLADAMDGGLITAYRVFLNADGFGCIDMLHCVPACDLICEVCDAITRVYATDTTVSNARHQNAV